MQEEVTQRTVALCVEATRLSAGMLQQAMKLHAALHACTTMNENQVQQTRQYGKI